MHEPILPFKRSIFGMDQYLHVHRNQLFPLVKKINEECQTNGKFDVYDLGHRVFKTTLNVQNTYTQIHPLHGLKQVSSNYGRQSVHI